ncbi:hypothetical protein CRG98_044774 [Punica granatum]|uniref:Uncharacterized protein n=1 Tax=Punica granatum TaxID=22663 RepID=A0A2I0HT07_PUNGR|nr:hypothetical protein CRG98_044774 [Punica granatum]
MAFLANEMAMEADELGSIFVLCAVVFSLIVISMVQSVCLSLICVDGDKEQWTSDVETAAEKLNNSPVDEGPKLPRIAGGNGMAMNENRDQLDAAGTTEVEIAAEAVITNVLHQRRNNGAVAV